MTTLQSAALAICLALVAILQIAACAALAGFAQ